MLFLFLALLPSLSEGITNFGTCDGAMNKLCLATTDCITSGFTGATCNTASGPSTGGAQGCCTGGTADTTTTTAASLTTRAVTVACVDKTNPRTGVSDCSASASLCTNNVYRNFMRVQCPKTCGLCSGVSTVTRTSGPIRSCVDRLNPRTGVSDCANRKMYCSNSVYQSLMRIQCPATCGFCASG